MVGSYIYDTNLHGAKLKFLQNMETGLSHFHTK